MDDPLLPPLLPVEDEWEEGYNYLIENLRVLGSAKDCDGRGTPEPFHVLV